MRRTIARILRRAADRLSPPYVITISNVDAASPLLDLDQVKQQLSKHGVV